MRVVAWLRTGIIPWIGKASPFFFLCAVVMVASLILGGGTRGGFLSDAILELLAIPLLLMCFWKLFEVPLTKQMRLALWFCLAIAVLPLIQLIPLPPWLWTVLPNRQPSVEAFDIVGHAVPWMPISVSPQATWLSALSLVPALAIFLGTFLLAYHERRWLSLVVLAVGIISLFVGLAQVAQGPNSPLRFFEVTNPTEAVGFFANRNHFAALLYCLTLFVAAWTMHVATIRTARDPKKDEYNVVGVVGLIAGFIALVGLLAGEAMARSRAGLGLTIVALFGALALGIADRQAVNFSNWRAGFTPTKVLVGAIALATVFAIQFALYRVMDRFAFDPLQDVRYLLAHHTFEAAKAYMPLGSGSGTFVPVYAMFERPEDVSDAYVNHAHNDALEVLLETGVVGLVLLGLFVTWLIWRSLEIWRLTSDYGTTALDRSLARAATIAAALILVHSLVDYPLRTGSMMAIMAFACALLIPPPTGARREELQSLTISENGAHRAARKSKPTPAPRRPSIDTPEDTPAAARGTPDQRWGADINWPKEWSNSSRDGEQSQPSVSKPQNKPS
jgi:O-antigen ligase